MTELEFPDINDNQYGAINNYDISGNIPWGWKEVICTCPKPGYPEIAMDDQRKMKDYANTFGRVPTDRELHCSHCGKRYRWQFMYCSQCADYFDWQFFHHAILGSVWRPEVPKGWAWAKRICWNCIIKQDPAIEGDRAPEFLSAPRGNPQIAWDFNISFD